MYILITVTGGVLHYVSTFVRLGDAIGQAVEFCKSADPDDDDCMVYESNEATPNQFDLPIAWSPKGKTIEGVDW